MGVGSRAEPLYPGKQGGDLGLAANLEIVCSRQQMKCLHYFFPLTTLRSHPAERFGCPRPNEALPEGIQRTIRGAEAFTFPEWCITRLIYVKLCRDNSPPRQATNPLDYAFGMCHPNWLLHAAWHEGGP